MYLTYKQKFLQQKNLEQTLYGKFGYDIQSMNQVVQKKKKNEQYPITANIKLRKVTPSLYKNQKILQIQKQLQQIGKQRKRRQQQQKLSKNPQDLNKYIKKMQYVVNQYNYLIDHKHIKQKGSDLSRQMLNIQPKTQSQKALQQIQLLKEKLVQANIKEQFAINKKIIQLYRLFKKNIDAPILSHRKRAVSQQTKQNTLNQSNIRIMSQAMNQSQRAHSSIMQKMQKIVKNKSNQPLNTTVSFKIQKVRNNVKFSNYLNVSLDQHHLKKVKSHNDHDRRGNKSIQPVFINERQKKPTNEIIDYQSKKQRMQDEINEPYVPKAFIQNSKKMDIKIKNNNQALQLWKGRIAQAIPLPQIMRNQKQSIIKNPSIHQSDIQSLDDQTFDLKKHVPYIENKKYFKQETVESLKNKNRQQEQILSSLLGKRHCKYLRPWGTKILVQYNAAKQAKEMLGLSPGNNQHQKEHSQTQNHKEHTNKKLNQSKLVTNLQNKLELPLDNKNHLQNQQQKDQLDWDNQIDEQYYWTMCKNQKINLLLKGKRR